MKFISDTRHILPRKLENNEEALKVFGVELGDIQDRYNLDLYNLYQEMLKHDNYRRVQAKHRLEGYSDTGIPTDKDENIHTGIKFTLFVM